MGTTIRLNNLRGTFKGLSIFGIIITTKKNIKDMEFNADSLDILEGG